MSLTNRLAEWRDRLVEDGSVPSDDEAVLELFLSAGIDDFLKANLERIEEADIAFSRDPEDAHLLELDRVIDEWVDEYAGHAVAAPTEPPHTP